MNKRLHKSRVLTNWDRYKECGNDRMIDPHMRYANDIFLIHQICDYFRPSSVCEIGFYAGQTFGTLIDACEPDTKFVSIDLKFEYKKLFDELYGDQNKDITFIESNSLDIPDLGQEFDLIMIDGNHGYKYVKHDVEISLKALNKHSILILDDHLLPGVNRVINEDLLGQHDWVPFISGDQIMAFHHVSHRADEFLDTHIQYGAKNFIYFHNYDYKEHVVLRSFLPNIFKENVNFFIQALEFYKI